MYVKYTINYIFLFLLIMSCKKEEIAKETNHIEGKNFDDGLRIEGHEFDSLIIENCVFKNKPLNLNNCNYVVIRNSTFKDIHNSGIRVGFNGECTNLLIENCTFKDIGFNGVDSHEDAPNAIIRNCVFENNSLSQIGTAMGEPHHNIYWKAPGVIIESNHFDAKNQKSGNIISIRSSGIIRKNVIKNGSTNAIMYYADHPGGDTLLIENNFIHNHNHSGIMLRSAGDKNWHNNNIIIRFNSIVDAYENAVYVDDTFEKTTEISIYGNIFSNASQQFIKSSFKLNEYVNLETSEDIGFVDVENGDLHLLDGSTAIGYASSIQDFPLDDIDGEKRKLTTLCVGADEY